MGAGRTLREGTSFDGRPHRPCVDGAKDGELTRQPEDLSDPIRLVRMVKQIRRYERARDLIHHPHKADGV